MDCAAITSQPLHETMGLIIQPSHPMPISALPAQEVAALFKQHGVLLFRNFTIDCAGFTEFTARFCHDFSSYQGGGFRWGKLDREKINDNETLLTVTGATQSFGIPLHGEMYYMKVRPTVLWFFCEEPPATAGETIVCSGAELLKKMDPAGRDFFSRNKLKYVRHLLRDEWPVSFQTEDIDVLRSWCEANECHLSENADGSVTIEYVISAILPDPVKGEPVFINNALLIHSAEQSIRSGLAAQVLELPRNSCPFVVRSENGEELPASVIDQVERTAQTLTAKVVWRKGDVLMIDNRRILHGRKKCRGTDRKIFVRMGEPAFPF